MIINYQRIDGELLHETRLLFKKKFLHHSSYVLLDKVLLEVFYRDLANANKAVTNYILMDNIICQPYAVDLTILDQMAMTN